jgi:uncharacterized membrane protein YoaK (UPF0700 family)
MNGYLFAVLWGFVVGIFLGTACDLLLTDWQFWILAVLLNLPNYFVHNLIFKKNGKVN